MEQRKHLKRRVKLKKKMLKRRRKLQYICNKIEFADAMKFYKSIYNNVKTFTYTDETMIMSKRKKKSDIDLIKIINRYHKNQNDDVVQIFELNNKGIDLPNTDKFTKFGNDDHLIKKYFTDVKIVKKKHLVEAYKKLVKDKTPEGAKDTATHTRTPHSVTVVYKL
ncbi:hypothetical protein DVH24_004844 [Malus domestica]|uniref:Uncharacterized protein n=1 Tax=Malus domestica TaxID=3750 RepID=A0A498ICH1_MALDO|nr:hypothetical protein DVH24_004844 [Malus domestica]